MGKMITTPSACIQAEEGSVAKVVLMPGDPLRAKYVAEHYLENAKCFNTVRNMLGYTGTYEGKEVSVMGSGMGIPSIYLYAYELYNFFDVDAIIRIGSAGGIADGVKLRDIVIAMTASTNSAFPTLFNLPGTTAPVADYEMLKYAVEEAEKKNVRTDVGSVYTSDYFYYLDANNPVALTAKETGHLAVEMETAGLYLTATVCKKKALSILTITDHLFDQVGLPPEERQDSLNDMMEIALKTAVRTMD